jgi:hypothetical protein
LATFLKTKKQKFASENNMEYFETSAKDSDANLDKVLESLASRILTSNKSESSQQPAQIVQHQADNPQNTEHISTNNIIPSDKEL